MSDRTPARPSAPGRGRLIAASVVLAIAIIVPLLVWTYARTSPELAGIPFFYWYQFMLVIVAVALTAIAHRLVLSHDRDRRASEGLDRDGGAA
jgi:uncharacterized membrane protein